MYEVKKYDGQKELQELLKKLPHIPTNTEIVEKTGMSKGNVSDIMNGKRIPTEKFVLAFKKGFELDGTTKEETIKNPQPNGEGLKDKMILLLETSLARVEAELNRVLQENERLKNK